MSKDTRMIISPSSSRRIEGPLGYAVRQPNGIWHWHTADADGYCPYREDARRQIGEDIVQEKK